MVEQASGSPQEGRQRQELRVEDEQELGQHHSGEAVGGGTDEAAAGQGAWRRAEDQPRHVQVDGEADRRLHQDQGRHQEDFAGHSFVRSFLP